MRNIDPQNIQIRLSTSSELDDIRKFLFFTYCLVDGWYPPVGDPAHFRVEGNRLLDDRDFLSTHFIALANGVIVGCVRASFRVAGKLQFEIYDDDQAPSNFDVEISRFSIVPSMRKTSVGLRLMDAMLSWCIEKGFLACCPPSEPKLLEHYMLLGIPHATGRKPFYYYKDDKPVTLLAGKDLDDQKSLLEGIRVVLRRRLGKDDKPKPNL